MLIARLSEDSELFDSAVTPFFSIASISPRAKSGSLVALSCAANARIMLLGFMFIAPKINRIKPTTISTDRSPFPPV